MKLPRIFLPCMIDIAIPNPLTLRILNKNKSYTNLKGQLLCFSDLGTLNNPQFLVMEQVDLEDGSSELKLFPYPR